MAISPRRRLGLIVSSILPDNARAYRRRFARAGLTAGLALIAVLILKSAGAASAAVDVSSASVCAETTISAFLDADAWVAENNTSTTGSDAILIVEANPSSGNSRALVRFQLPSGVPPGCIVESARRRLYTPAGSEGARVEAALLASEWSEGSVIWSNQPDRHLDPEMREGR
jgi:hypothetical protein